MVSRSTREILKTVGARGFLYGRSGSEQHSSRPRFTCVQIPPHAGRDTLREASAAEHCGSRNHSFRAYLFWIPGLIVFHRFSVGLLAKSESWGPEQSGSCAPEKMIPGPGILSRLQIHSFLDPRFHRFCLKKSESRFFIEYLHGSDWLQDQTQGTLPCWLGETLCRWRR